MNKDFNGVIDSLELAIANGKGIDHVLHLLDDLKDIRKLIADQQTEIKKYQSFHKYFSELYGQGLEVANWHQNGDLEPFDEFFDSAEQEMGENK